MILNQTIKNLQKENRFLKAELERVKKEQQDTQKHIAGNLSFFTAVVAYPDFKIEKISPITENEGFTIQEIIDESISQQFLEMLYQAGARIFR